MLLDALHTRHEGIRIDSRGGIQEVESQIMEVMEGASLTDAVNALWLNRGRAGLEFIGIEGEEAQIIWEQQAKNPNPSKLSSKV